MTLAADEAKGSRKNNFTFLRPRVDPLEIPGNRLKDADERGSASPLAFVPSLNIRMCETNSRFGRARMG